MSTTKTEIQEIYKQRDALVGVVADKGGAGMSLEYATHLMMRFGNYRSTAVSEILYLTLCGRLRMTYGNILHLPPLQEG